MYNGLKYIHGGKFISNNVWIHPDRVIDSNEIIIMIKGTAYINANDKNRVLTAGDILRIDPGERHFGYKTSDDGASFYWLHFLLDDKSEPLPPEFFTPEDSYQAELICRQIIHCERTDGYPCDVCDLLMRVLLAELCFQSRNTDDGESQLFRSICDYVRKNSEKMIRVSDVAKQFSYNPDYLCRFFKRYYKPGIKQYIDNVKIERIKKELISENSDLKTVAYNNSFTDYKYFLKFFKYHEGVTPSEFRNSYCDQNINNK
mgnify:CR=1 FL=1